MFWELPRTSADRALHDVRHATGGLVLVSFFETVQEEFELPLISFLARRPHNTDRGPLDGAHPFLLSGEWVLGLDEIREAGSEECVEFALLVLLRG